MTEITSRFKTISPQAAGTIMASRVKNRKIKETRVAQFVAMHARGEFVPEESVLSFNEYGLLVDGQHRLMMVQEVNETFKFRCQYGVGKAFFSHCDDVSIRSLADMLHMRDEVNVTSLAATIRQIWGYDSCGTLHPNTHDKIKVGWPSNAVFLNFFDEHLTVRESVTKSRTWGNHTAGMLPASLMAATHYIFSRHDEDLADSFWDVIAYGASDGDEPLDGKTDPRLVLRNRLIKQLLSRSEKMPHRFMGAIVIKSWNAWVQGETLKVLSWNPAKGEKYPAIVGV